MLFHGTAFGREHLRFAEFTPEERRRHYQEMTAALSQGAEAAGALVTDFSGYPGRVEFAVRVPGFAVREADYLYVRLPELLEGFLDLRSDARVHPLYLADGVRQSVRAEIRRPNGFSLAYWPPFVQESGVGRAGLAARLQVELRAAETSSVVVVEGRAVRQPCIVEAERYPELLRLDQSLEHAGSRTVVFRQVPEEGGTSDVLSADCQGPE
jgi:hypothetical protein